MTRTKQDTTSARAVIEEGVIVIRLPLKHLDMVLKGCDDFEEAKVTSPKKFGKEVVRYLNNEDEVGTNAIHRMFDEAFREAIENGAEGVRTEGDEE
jgi:hypothetical protein